MKKKTDNRFVSEETIPDVAKRLASLLKKAGYSKNSPYRTDGKKIKLEQTINMPGTLEFASVGVSAIWPERGSVAFIDENGHTQDIIINSFQDYGNGYIEAWWNDLGALTIISGKIELVLADRKKKPLLDRLRRLLPKSGIRLVFTRDRVAEFHDYQDIEVPFQLLSAWSENDEPMVRYLTGSGEITDFVRDLHPSDIREIIRVVKR